MPDCTTVCEFGKHCTCGAISPMLYRAIRLDMILFQVVTLGRARRYETASAAAYRGEQMGLLMGRFWRPVIDFLFSKWGRQPHCKNAYEWQRSIYGE